MHQWDGVWDDTLPGLEFLVSGTRRADIVAHGFHGATMRIFRVPVPLLSNQYASTPGKAAAIGVDRQTYIGKADQQADNRHIHTLLG